MTQLSEKHKNLIETIRTLEKLIKKEEKNLKDCITCEDRGIIEGRLSKYEIELKKLNSKLEFYNEKIG